MGIPIDPTTGNLVGSVPQLLQVPERLPAGAADDADRLSRQSRELSAHSGHDTNVPGSELLNPANFSANPIAGSAVTGKDHRYRRNAER